MKKAILALAVLLAAGNLTFAHDGHDKKQKKHAKKATKYTCTMHPEIVMNKPGDCPKCGMKLVVKKETRDTKKK